jgi:hypothetical protein
MNALLVSLALLAAEQPLSVSHQNDLLKTFRDEFVAILPAKKFPAEAMLARSLLNSRWPSTR